MYCDTNNIKESHTYLKKVPTTQKQLKQASKQARQQRKATQVPTQKNSKMLSIDKITFFSLFLKVR